VNTLQALAEVLHELLVSGSTNNHNAKGVAKWERSVEKYNRQWLKNYHEFSKCSVRALLVAHAGSLMDRRLEFIELRYSDPVLVQDLIQDLTVLSLTGFHEVA
jgi:hypothetical protein